MTGVVGTPNWLAPELATNLLAIEAMFSQGEDGTLTPSQSQDAKKYQQQHQNIKYSMKADCYSLGTDACDYSTLVLKVSFLVLVIVLVLVLPEHTV